MRSQTWLCCELGRTERPRCKDKWEAQAPHATGVLAAARCSMWMLPTKPTLPFSWQCPLLRAWCRESPDAKKLHKSPLNPPSYRDRSSQPCNSHCAARRRPAAFPHRYFLPLAAVWGCQKPKQEWKHPIFLAKNQHRVVFFLWFWFFYFFFLFFSLVFG